MNKKSANLIFPVTVFLIFSGILIFLNLQNVENQKDIFEVRDILAKLNQLPDNNILENKIKELNSKKEAMNNFLVDKNDPLFIIEKVENLIKTYNLQGEVRKAEFVEENLVLEILAEGSFENIIKLISDLEKIDKQFSIEVLQVSKNQAEKQVSWGMFMGVIVKTK